jgi:uncharacterized membrane protein HdeD (DUF308 family)
MNNQGLGRYQKVPTRVLVATIVILAGILLLAFGYFAGSTTALYAGWILTLGGVLLEFFFILVQGRGEPQ